MFLKLYAKFCSLESKYNITHNQNSCKELLKNMKDGDSLNTILGYAKHIEGTPHGEHLSTAYLDTIKIPNSNVKAEVITQKCNASNKRKNSKHQSQSKGKPNNKGNNNCCNCGTNHPPKKCPAYGKNCYSCNKKGHFKPFCRSRQRSQSQGKWKPRQSRRDQHEITSTNNRDQNDDSSWFQFEQDSIQVLFSRGICSDINSKSNIQFDKINSKGFQHVLTDLTLIKANGPKCSYASTNLVEYIHHFKVESGASGNLLPLCLYRKIFPNLTQTELERSIDHRVQLLADNKKVIKQLGFCYLHVRNSQGHTKLCKFFIVNSKFNLIIGVSCSLRLGLITFNLP